MAAPKLQSFSTGPDGKWTVLGICVLLAVAVFMVFGQTLRYGFVNFDDDGYFSSNYHVKAGLTWSGVSWAFRTGHASNWHPLTWLSLMLDAQLFGTGPSGPHLTNVLSARDQYRVVVSPAKVPYRHIMARRLCGGAVRHSSAPCGIGGLGVRAQRRIKWVVLHADAVDVCAVCTELCQESGVRCQVVGIARLLACGSVFRVGADEQADAGVAAICAFVAGLLAARKGDK